MKTTKALVFAVLAAAYSASFSAVAADKAVVKPAVEATAVSPELLAVTQNLKRLYPKTTFSHIREAGLPGIFEVVMGRNIAYTDGTGRNFIFGHLYDMPTQRDLTQARLDELGIPSVAANDVREPSPVAQQPSAQTENRIEFAALPKNDAFQIVKGNGKRRMAVFSDPDCPFCKRLEENLVGLDDVTIDLYLFPIAQLHPDAARKSQAVWCAKNKAKTWNDMMIAGQDPGNATCANPIERNVALAKRLNINGTPTLVLPSGRVIPGAIPLASLQPLLDAEQR